MGRYQGEQFIDIEEVERFGSKNKELNPDSTPTREDTGGAPFVVQEIPSSGEVDFFEVSECIEELIHAENEEEVYVAVRDIPKEYIPRVIRALREELEVDFFVEANEDDSYERSALTDFEWEVQEHIEHQEFDDKDYFERIFFALEKIVYHSKKVEYGEIKDELYMLLERIAGARMIREISKTLSFIGGTEAARDCMNRLRTTDSVIIQEKYSRALYLLELGKIGVNSGVVNYLEQQYILKGDDEDNVDFARRITGDGKIGLFDERGGFVGYFELGDLITGDVEREAQILEISRDLLFSDPHTPDDIRQQFFADYTYFYE